MTTIKIDRVTKTIHKSTVLKGISLEMHSGKVYGLQGINGSGKTMLMRIVSGLIFPTEGTVFIDEKRLGKDITFPDSVGLLLENPAFLNGYSGFQNLKMLASIQGKISDTQIKDTISAVGLNPEDKKKYKKYSLGMKQRLGIAAAVMEAPDIVIMDEPTNSLDDSGVEIVKRIVLEQKARGAVVILSCHDYSVLEMLSDEIFKIKEGAIADHILLPTENSSTGEGVKND